MAGVKLSFRGIWKFVMIAEIIFILPELIRLLWFLVLEQPESFRAIENFHPFSLLSLMDADKLSPKYHYPFGAINLFEVAYWFVLALGIHTLCRRSYTTSLGIVLGSYTLGFFLWLGFYMAVYK